MYFVVGLGNPGEEYENTRHNVGWNILDEFCGDDEWEFSKNAEAFYCKKSLGKERVEFIKPATFMNKSGKSVKYAVGKHNPKIEKLIVVHDDMDLPLGKIKLVKGRGSGGHKGVESVKRAIGTNEFVRVRIGIAKSTPKGKIKKPSGESAVQKFVLGKWSSDEQREFIKVSKRAVEAIETIIQRGVVSAQNLYN
jgi:PTH1 family peptidyl-tRNA hydrolase